MKLLDYLHQRCKTCVKMFRKQEKKLCVASRYTSSVFTHSILINFFIRQEKA